MSPPSSVAGHAAATDARSSPDPHRRVLVTRPQHQAQEVCILLRGAGFDPLCVPALTVEPLTKLDALDEALRRLSEYGCLVFSSANAARIVCERAARLPIHAAEWVGREIVAGPRTAAALARHGVHATLALPRFSAEAALSALATISLHGRRVLLPRTVDGRELGAGLRALGVVVDEIAVYRTRPVSESPALVRALRERAPRAVVFFSPSAVTGFTNALRAGAVGEHVLQGVLVACIGGTTAAAARAAGLDVALVPRETTASALVDGLSDLLLHRAAPAAGMSA